MNSEIKNLEKEKKSFKVSVIIPIYNVEKYLPQCIESALAQTLDDIEIILIDDESPDNCPKMCDEYKKNNSRIVVIHQKNKGLGGARNAGLKIARGEYILFLDSDDWIEKTACEIMYNKATSTGADLVLSGETLYIEKEKRFIEGWRNFQNYNTIDEIVENNFIDTFTPAWGRLYRTSFLKKNNMSFVEKCFYEDNSWGCLCAILAKKIAFVDNQFFYRQRSNAITSIKDEKVFDWVNDYIFFMQFIKTNKLVSKKINYGKIWYLLNFYNYYMQLSKKNKDIFYKKINKIMPMLNLNLKTIFNNKIIKQNKKLKLFMFYVFLNNPLLKFFEPIFCLKSAQILKKIFSIRNSDDKKQKVITILGFKIKIRKNNNYFKFYSDKYAKEHAIVAEYLNNNYINKYLNNEILKREIIPKKNLNTDKIIWQFWDKGYDNLPEIIKVCFKSIDKYKGEYTVIRLNEKTVKEYIDIPDFIYKKFHSNKDFKPAFFADLVRLYLLSAYGGIWMDATIYLTAPIPKKILNMNFFMFQRNIHEKNKKYWKSKSSCYFGFSKDFRVNLLNSFIIAKKGNLIIDALKDILTEYWAKEDKFIHYFLFQILFNELIKIKTYKRANCKIISDIPAHLMQVNFKEEYTDKLWSRITNKTSIHKLTYKIDDKEKMAKNSLLDYLIKKGE